MYNDNANNIPVVTVTPIQEQESFKYQYHKKYSVMTPAEHELFHLLNGCFNDKYYIFPQVHLSTLFGHTIYGQSWRGALSHIDRKSIDFAMCDKETMRPILAIELDDRSHDKYDRQLRDAEVDKIFANADLPLLRIQNHGTFVTEDIKKRVEERIGIQTQ